MMASYHDKCILMHIQWNRIFLLISFSNLYFYACFQDTMGWGENDRGVSFTFGAEVAAKFLHKHDFDLICRAHQVVEDGK